jgi:hypothetical protein
MCCSTVDGESGQWIFFKYKVLQCEGGYKAGEEGGGGAADLRLYSYCSLSLGYLASKVITIHVQDKFINFILVSEGKGLDQPACQEGWKKCKEEEE